MGNLMARSKDLSKRVIWCDTEGGIRGVPMWDVTFIDEGPGEKVRALRLFSVSDAHKAGRAKLRKYIPMGVVVGRFYDGCRNDTWTYSLDGNDLGTYGAYFEGARCNGGFTQEITSRLKIRPAFDNNANNIGFYFDDISYRAYRMADTNDIFASYFTSFEPAPPPRPPGLVFMVY